mmetsp:Transcript_41557/g.81969  ORF Transcript_41557/g.81969 Transcript_41557/m.81969 type:complete len:101 (+) Transcript_41557:472-774(+)
MRRHCMPQCLLSDIHAVSVVSSIRMPEILCMARGCMCVFMSSSVAACVRRIALCGCHCCVPVRVSVRVRIALLLGERAFVYECSGCVRVCGEGSALWVYL